MTPTLARIDSATPRRVVVIGAGPEAIPFIEPDLVTSRYQIAFVDRSAPMYRTLREVCPDVIVLCFAPDDEEACRLLTLLEFDAVLRRIPLVVVEDEACAILGAQWGRNGESATAKSGGAPCVAR